MINYLGKRNRKITEIIKVIRFNKLSLNGIAVTTTCTILKDKLQIINAVSVYHFSNLFNLPSLKNLTLSYIERCFTIVSDNKSFLELEHNLISEVLASSELLITSEIEVFKVANKWLNYNIEERSKYAKDLFLKVRLDLLSTETIKRLLNDEKFFEKGNYCVKILNKMLDCKEKKLYKSSSKYNTARYCNQKYFKHLVLGGYNITTRVTCSNVNCIDVNKVGDIEAYPRMITGRHFPEVVYLKGDIYVFGDWIKSVEKYSLTSKTWNQVAEMNDDHYFFCACAFIHKIFIIGGHKGGSRTNFCSQFDTSDYSWKEVAEMNEARSSTACAVFKERIIVSGGLNNNFNDLNSVESYDVLPDKWSSMPNMNSGKYDHSLVVVNNNLFVISKREDGCEMFDNICKKFVTIKSPQFDLSSRIRVYSIKNTIFVLQDDSSKIITYDTNKNEWSEESCEVTKNIRGFSSVKVPFL